MTETVVLGRERGEPRGAVNGRDGMCHSIVVAVALVAGLANGGGQQETGTPPIFDKRPYAEAKKAAEEGKKWLIVKATAVWCQPCKRMDATTWRDEQVVKWLKANAIAVVFDVDKEKTRAKELSIEAMPTMIAFKEGKEFDRVVGYQSPEEFLVWLEGIARGEKAITAIRARAGDRDAPEGKVDVQARLDLARKLAQDGKLDEATDEYVWLWQHMLEHDQSYYGVRGSFMASDMKRLAGKHAAAKKKFTALRDEITPKLDGEKVEAEAMEDWVTLNDVIGDTKATLEWYDKVKDQPRWLPLVKRVSRNLRELFIAQKRWADVGRLYARPVEELEQQHALCAMMPKGQPPEGLPEEERKRLEDMPNEMLRQEAGILYAGLLAAGREEEAGKLAKRARELDESAAMVAELVGRALEAGQARAQHLEWIDQCGKADKALGELRVKTQGALENRK